MVLTEFCCTLEGQSITLISYDKIENKMKPIWLSVDFVRSIVDPFEVDPWGSGLVTHQMMKESNPIAEPWNPDDDDQLWNIEQQAGRIRWLVENEWKDPIYIDVGVPTLGYYLKTILDGHHRLGAAIYKGDSAILCFVDGQLDVIYPHIVKCETIPY